MNHLSNIMMFISYHQPSGGLVFILLIWILPANAQCDLEIMGLLCQLALCDEENQNVQRSIVNNRALFDGKFVDLSSLATRTPAVYGLPDHMQHFEHPWRPDRWRFHCRTVISDNWDEKLRAKAGPRSSSQFTDVDSLLTIVPMRICQQAGINFVSVKQATIVSWMYCSTYFTWELMHTMHKVCTS